MHHEKIIPPQEPISSAKMKKEAFRKQTKKRFAVGIKNRAMAGPERLFIRRFWV
jgi:hypothetical protein